MRIWESILLLCAVGIAVVIRIWIGVTGSTQTAVPGTKVIKKGICGPFLSTFVENTTNNTIKTTIYATMLRDVLLKACQRTFSGNQNIALSTDKGYYPLRTHQELGFMGVYAHEAYGVFRKESFQ